MVYEATESFYEGGESSFNSDYGNFTGYRMNASQLGFSGSPQTANQIGEAINAIKQGVKVFEVQALVPDTAETIPTQHFHEMKALMKLTGVKPSLHGPLIDPAGFGEKGWEGNEGRADNERRMFNAIENAHILDPTGNIPIVFHSANGAPGSEWRPGDESKGEKKFIMEKGTAINKETGEMIGLKREYKFRPDKEGIKQLDKGGTLFTAEASVDSANLGRWESSLTEIAQMNKHAEEIIGSAPLFLKEYKNAVVADPKQKIIYEVDSEGRPKKELPWFKDDTQEANYNKMRKAGLFLENAELSFNGAFHQAYKYGSDKQKKVLKDLAENYSKEKNKAGVQIWSPVKRQRLLDEAIMDLGNITENRIIIKDGKKVLDENWGTPQIFEDTEKFAMEKAAKTFGNLAMKSYDKFGTTAPILAIENLYPGVAFNRAKDMKKLVEKSRKNFANQLIEEENMSKSEAKEIAKKHLGVTWDVGHLNIMKKHGFTDKDVIEQTKEITKDKTMVKHLHLTDNFGYADTHLPPGMGNVPIKGILEELEKTGRLGEMRQIVEAGGFVQHFKKSPHPLALSAIGSPIYGMKAGPSWNDAMNIQGSYFGGYGSVNPQIHHSYFGAGFTTMPVELGGQMPGGQSRFGGTPMS